MGQAGRAVNPSCAAVCGSWLTPKTQFAWDTGPGVARAPGPDVSGRRQPSTPLLCVMGQPAVALRCSKPTQPVPAPRPQVKERVAAKIARDFDTADALQVRGGHAAGHARLSPR